jgi:ankyrin repeat protein
MKRYFLFANFLQSREHLGSLDVVNYLILEKSVPVDLLGENGYTPLLFACAHGKVQ